MTDEVNKGEGVVAYLFQWEEMDGLWLHLNGHEINLSEPLSDEDMFALLSDPALNPQGRFVGAESDAPGR
jgi:hypothetical protein